MIKTPRDSGKTQSLAVGHRLSMAISKTSARGSRDGHRPPGHLLGDYTHQNRTVHTGLSKGESSGGLEAIVGRDTECLEKLFRGHEAKEKEKLEVLKRLVNFAAALSHRNFHTVPLCVFGQTTMVSFSGGEPFSAGAWRSNLMIIAHCF
jgi:hypothetical protein